MKVKKKSKAEAFEEARKRFEIENLKLTSKLNGSNNQGTKKEQSQRKKYLKKMQNIN